jgi:RNA polymerase sigma-70 factor, ECF subfamily
MFVAALNRSEETTVAQARAGSMDALEELYSQHAERVYGVALRYLRVPADAQDAVHDVFVALPRALQQYTHRAAFWSWLRQVTVRYCLMKLRASKRSAGATPLEQQRASKSSDAIDQITIDQALARLPESLRLVFLLKEIEGYSHSEIAGMLDITVAGSTLRLHRAWKQLRKELGNA